MSDIKDELCSFIKSHNPEPENDRPGMMFAFDEIVTGPVDSVHIERMSDNSYWMCIYKGDEGQRIMISSTSSRGKIVARTELFEFTESGRKKLDEWNAFQKREARDLADYTRLKAKFGEV